jgi:hypothetical protein
VAIRESETFLWPLRPDEVGGWIDGAGYSPVRQFGDFSGSPFLPESEAFVCIAFRP